MLTINELGLIYLETGDHYLHLLNSDSKSHLFTENSVLPLSFVLVIYGMYCIISKYCSARGILLVETWMRFSDLQM